MSDLLDGLDRPIPAKIVSFAPTCVESLSSHVSSAAADCETLPETYILKFPPTKNFRPILAVVDVRFRGYRMSMFGVCRRSPVRILGCRNRPCVYLNALARNFVTIVFTLVGSSRAKIGAEGHLLAGSIDAKH